MTNHKRPVRALLAVAAGLALATFCGSAAQAENRGGPPRSSAPSFSCGIIFFNNAPMAAVTLASGTAGTTNDIDVTVVTSGGPVQTAVCGLAFSGSKTVNAQFTNKFPPGKTQAPAGYLYTCSAVQAKTNNMCATHF